MPMILASSVLVWSAGLAGLPDAPAPRTPGSVSWCPEPRAVAAYVADYEAHRVSRGFGDDLTLTDAECAKRVLVAPPAPTSTRPSPAGRH